MKSNIKQIINTLKNSAFIKKGQSWYLNGADNVVVINLQKSNWDKGYYINIGIWIKSIGKAEFPIFNQCHLAHRVERIFPEDSEVIRRACVIDQNDVQAMTSFLGFLEDKLIPFLQDCTKIDKLKNYYLKGRFKYGLVNSDARVFFNTRE